MRKLRQIFCNHKWKPVPSVDMFTEDLQSDLCLDEIGVRVLLLDFVCVCCGEVCESKFNHIAINEEA